MVKIIFEDNPNTPSSKLLNESSFNKGNFIFTGGGDGTLRYLREHHGEPFSFLVFVDVVPNNVFTLSTYQTIDRLCKRFENVEVFPVLCIEYIILKLIHSLDMDFYSKSTKEVLGVLFGECTPSEETTGMMRKRSLEKVCKTALSNHMQYCFRNTTKEDNPVYGEFYRECCGKCNTGSFRCKFNSTLDRVEKAERLYTMLPIFDVISEEHKDYLRALGICTSTCNLDEVLDDCQEFYDRLCSVLDLIPIQVLRR